jgi:hypothetical protein
LVFPAEVIEIPTRASLFRILLLISIGLVVWRTYSVWQAEPWDLPMPKAPSTTVVANAQPVQTKPAPPITSTEIIVSKNLFDPERGAGISRQSEDDSQAFQRVNNMLLIGTMILGENHTAILQDRGGPTVGSPNQARMPVSLRMKVGENFEGFTLSQIADKKVVFTKGASQVELALDYFRKVEIAAPRSQNPAQIGTSGAAAPRVIPNLPRRERVPVNR